MQAREHGGGVRSDHQAAADEQRVEHQQDQVADQAELLGEHREDEVGVALGDELEVRLGAVQPALAGQAAGAHRDGRLDDVIARAERVLGRVEQREDALALVVVQHAPEREQARRGRAPRGRRAPSS